MLADFFLHGTCLVVYVSIFQTSKSKIRKHNFIFFMGVVREDVQVKDITSPTEKKNPACYRFFLKNEIWRESDNLKATFNVIIEIQNRKSKSKIQNTKLK